MPRRCKCSWLEEYLRYVTVATESPIQYHFWSAATVISATLKRHVFFDRASFKLYPNLYTVLVGRPGIGKGAAMHPALAILKEAGTSNVLSDRITMEYVLEKMSKGFPATSVNTSNQALKLGFESNVLIVSSELSVFIGASQFTITALTDLWDSKEGTYGYGTRGKGEYNILNPCVGLLGGSAHQWLVKSIPSDAVGGGFTRRVNFVLGTVQSSRNPWPSMNHSAIRDKLVEDLRDIGSLRGEMTCSKEARPVFEKLYSECEPNEFDDEATAGYKTSRWANVLKLAMVITAARAESLQISKEDLELAITYTEQVAADIPKVFRAVGESTLVSATDKVLRFVETKGYATRQEILHALWRHVSSEDLDRIIVTMREAGYLGERCIGSKTEYFDTRSQQP